jgi:Flp pilus assembly protein TadG
MSMHRRKSRRCGAQLIEVSLIAVPLFGLTFLLLDVSMAVFLRSTFQHAVREGVRYGITGDTPAGTCQDDAVKNVVKQNAIGFLNSATAAATIHVHFTDPASGARADNSPLNIIEVSVEGYQYTPLALYQRSGAPRIWARAFDVMERYPGSHPCLTLSE